MNLFINQLLTEIKEKWRISQFGYHGILNAETENNIPHKFNVIILSSIL
jgi:hypothetical protein